MDIKSEHFKSEHFKCLNGQVPINEDQLGLRFRRSQHWLPTDQLQIGMYVAELDIPWLDTRFMFQGFVIEDKATLRELQRVARKARVDTVKLANRRTYRSRDLHAA